MKKDKKKLYAEWGNMWKAYDELVPMNTRQMQPMPVDTGMQGFQPQQAQMPNSSQPAQNTGNNNLGNVAQGIGRFAGQALNAITTGGPQLINALLPNQTLEREDRTLQRAMNPYSQGTGSQAIYGDGGKVKPIYTRDPNDPRLQAYNDSLLLYRANPNGVSKTENIFNKLWKDSGEKGINDYDLYKEAKKQGVKFFDDGSLNLDVSPYKEAIDRLMKYNYPNDYDNPMNWIYPEATGVYGFESMYTNQYKKPVQPIIYDETPPDNLPTMNSQSMEQFPVDIEQREFQKRGRTVMSPYTIEKFKPGVGWDGEKRLHYRESGYKPEYKEYENGGEIAKNGYKTRKRKQGNIQITEEIPIDMPVPIQNQTTAIPFSFSSNTFPTQEIQAPTPQFVQIPEQRKTIEFEKLLDLQGNAQFAPIFSGGYSREAAENMLAQLPEYFGEIPVLRSPDLYRDIRQNFQQFSNDRDWTRTRFENGGKIDFKEGQVLELDEKEVKRLEKLGYKFEY